MLACLSLFFIRLCHRYYVMDTTLWTSKPYKVEALLIKKNPTFSSVIQICHFFTFSIPILCTSSIFAKLYHFLTWSSICATFSPLCCPNSFTCSIFANFYIFCPNSLHLSHFCQFSHFLSQFFAPVPFLPIFIFSVPILCTRPIFGNFHIFCHNSLHLSHFCQFSHFL